MLTKARDGGQGFGFLESVYKRAMALELRKQNMAVKEEQPLKVYYDDIVIGDFSIDVFVEDAVVVELNRNSERIPRSLSKRKRRSRLYGAAGLASESKNG